MKTSKKKKQVWVKHDSKYDIYEFKDWRKLGAAAAFSGRHYRMNFIDTSPVSVVAAHRQHFCKQAGVAFDHLVCLEQVHGSNIIRVGKKDAGRGARSKNDYIAGTDGVITQETGVVLSVRSADCAPLFFYDAKRRAIGLAHVGWRGALAGLAAKMVQAMRVQFLSKAEDILVGIGPMIRACCYKVGEEFEPEFKGFVRAEKNGSFRLDLSGYIIHELMEQGILETNIQDALLCTFCQASQFHSFRKDGERARRMLSVLALI